MKIKQADTAIDHFHFSVLGTVGTMHKRILAYMEGHPRKPDWTICEIAHGMDLEKSTISARRHEMLDLYLLERGEKRHCSISGVFVETVRIRKNAQVEEFKQLAREMEGL